MVRLSGRSLADEDLVSRREIREQPVLQVVDPADLSREDVGGFTRGAVSPVWIGEAVTAAVAEQVAAGTDPDLDVLRPAVMRKPRLDRVGQVGDRRRGEAEQPEGIDAGIALGDAELAIVAEALEGAEQGGRGEPRRGRGCLTE